METQLPKVGAARLPGQNSPNVSRTARQRDQDRGLLRKTQRWEAGLLFW